MSADLNNPGGSTKAPSSELQKKFQTARLAAISCWPFVASAVLRLVPRWSTLVPTMGVDKHWRLYLNPEFVKEKTPAELALLITGHELQHVLGDHPNRLTQYRGQMLSIGGQPISLANVAHDLAINSNLQGFIDAAAAYRNAHHKNSAIPMALPKEALYPDKFTDKNGKPFPRGQVSEVYAALLTQLPKVTVSTPDGKGKGDGGDDGLQLPGDEKQPSPDKNAGCGKCGSIAGDGPAPWEDPSGVDPRDRDSGVTEIERELIARQVAKAAQEQESRTRGTVPLGIQRWAEVVLTPPKVDWRKQLRRAVKSGLNWVSGLYDYTYTKPNRRSGDVILPGFHRPTPRFVVVQDTSGSMGKKDYEASFSEIAAVIRASGHRRVPMLACDAAVSEIQYVSSISEFKMIGGGGTDMGVGIRAAVENHNMKLVICCTDGETPWVDRIEGVRVIVCLTRPHARDSVPSWMTVVDAYDR